MVNHILILIGLMVLAQGSFVYGDPPAQPETVRSFIAASNVVDRWFAREELFGKASDGKVQELLFHANNDIALRAAWERMIRGKMNRVRANSELGRKLQRESVTRFLGFIEGRVNVPIPKEWAEVLHETVLFEDGAVVPKTARMEPLFSENSKGWMHLKSQKIEKMDGEEILHIGEKTCRIPKDLLAEDFMRGGIYGVLSGDVCILLLPSIIGSYDIVSIRHANGEIQWREDVWQSVVGGFSGIPAKHLAIPVIHKSTIYVFGANGNGWLYLEAFDLKSGKPSLRFSTAY